MRTGAAGRSWILLSAVAAAALATCGSLAAGAGQSQAEPKWVQNVPRLKLANVLIVAGYSKRGGGFDFNGFTHGRMTVTVPRGWTVRVIFRNADRLPHSVAVVPWSAKPTQKTIRTAFLGATTPLPVKGTAAGGSASFRFRATRTGRYRLVCLVPGRWAAGMWDVLVVKAGAKAAGVKP